MEPMQFRLAEIRVNEHRSTERLVEYLHFDHDRRQGKPFHLFAIAEIHSSQYLYERLLDALHSALSQAKTLVSGMDGDPMVRFEKVVQRLNEALVRSVQTEAGTMQWDRVNLFVFQLAEGHLCFSGVGSLSNLFLQRQEDGRVRPFDLLGSLEQPEIVDQNKPLSAIICGNMNVGDVLFLGTQNIQAQRETLAISRVLQDLPPVAAATELQQRLTQLGTDERYLGLVVAGVAMTQAKPVAVATPAMPSVADDETEDIEDEPPLAVQSVQEFYETEQEIDQVLNNERSGPGIFQQLRAKAEHLTKASAKRIPALASSISFAGLRSVQPGYSTPKASYRSAGIGALVVLFLIGGGGFWIHSVRTKQAEQKLWTAIYEQAVDGKNKAEAALVYGDEDRARGQYTYALNQLKQLDQETPDRAQARSSLEQELTEIRNRLRRESVVAKPTVIKDFGEALESRGVVVSNGKAYVLHPAANSISVVQLSDSSVTTIAGPEDTRLVAIGAGRTTPMFVGENKGYFTIQGDKLTGLAATVSKATSISALTTYGQRVYTVDPSQSMVWRWNASATALNGETAYVKTPNPDLERATTIAIDSSVYVGTSAGKVIKLLSGKTENWNLATVDPELRSVTSLWTDAETPLLVIADAENKRLLVFKKDGSLLQQISSPEFKGPTHAWVDPASNTVFTLDGSRLLSVPLPRE